MSETTESPATPEGPKQSWRSAVRGNVLMMGLHRVQLLGVLEALLEQR